MFLGSLSCTEKKNVFNKIYFFRLNERENELLAERAFFSYFPCDTRDYSFPRISRGYAYHNKFTSAA